MVPPSIGPFRRSLVIRNPVGHPVSSSLEVSLGSDLEHCPPFAFILTVLFAVPSWERVGPVPAPPSCAHRSWGAPGLSPVSGAAGTANPAVLRECAPIPLARPALLPLSVGRWMQTPVPAEVGSDCPWATVHPRLGWNILPAFAPALCTGFAC